MLSSQTIRKSMLGASLGLGILLSAIAINQAFAFSPEEDLLKIKGYSPELIETSATQRSRQEWKEPSTPKHSPVERFFHNIYYGDWTGSIDEFGSQVIREH